MQMKAETANSEVNCEKIEINLKLNLFQRQNE